MTKTPDAERYFIALVDDEPRIHEFITPILYDEGLAERHASFQDPVSFVDFLKNGEDEPDLVLLDIHFENAGLSGVDIIPFIREDYPYVPVILLTGMDTDATREVQDDQFTYFIPKPVSPESLAKMIRFYLGKSRRTGEQFQALLQEMEDFREYQKLLEDEIATLQEAQEEAPQPEQTTSRKEKRDKRDRAFQRVQDLLSGLLQQSEIMPSFVKDLEGIFNSQYDLFKKVVEILIRFDVMDTSNPGLNIHKVKGTDSVFSARLSRKVRLLYYQSSQLPRRRLLRLDTLHDTKGMDRWLRENYDSYSA